MNAYGVFMSIIMLIIAFAIAYFLGRKRQIGFGWSLFFCFFLSPLIGFIITMLSRKYYKENPEPSKLKRVIGWILIIFFSFGLLGTYDNYTHNQNNDNYIYNQNRYNHKGISINDISFSIGFIGLGFYLIGLGKGRSFNSKELVEVNDKDLE